MANYKLSNDYWETSGVYDITQGKTQREINADLKTSAESTIKPETVSGGVATFEGGEGVPLKNLTVNIEPVQSGEGDPSPTNVRPITGWTGVNVTRTGKNIWANNKIANGKGLTLPYFGSAGNVYNATPDLFHYLIKVSANQTYYVRIEAAEMDATWGVYGAIKSVNAQISHSARLTDTVRYFTFTPQADDYWAIWLYKGTNWTEEEANAVKIQVTKEYYDYYVPYDGNTYSITFPSEAGTVYGGTLDVTNGVLTVDREMWSGTIADGTVQVTSNNYIRYQFYPTITHSPKQAGISTGKISNLCKYYYEDNYTYPHWYNNAYGTVQLFVPESVESSTPVQFVISLATPITYTLTPIEVKALLGQNNIWADCGDVDVEYGAYLTVVENQLGEKIPKVAVAPIEKTTTASKAYAVNEMFFMGDKLYIATSSIASGATFTVGTNCDETTLGEQIAALLNA